MTSHERLVRSARQNQRTIYMIAALYIVIGLLVATYSAISGQVLVAFVGLILVGLGVGAAVILPTILRLSERVSTMIQMFSRTETRLERIEKSLKDLAAIEHESTSQTIDLASVGRGDPGGLTGAVLDRSGFPRLVAALDEIEQTKRNRTPQNSRSTRISMNAPADDETTVIKASFPNEHSPGSKDLMHRWMIAMREGDVTTCREVLSTLIDTADPELVDEYQGAFDDLVTQTEQRLRSEFSRCLRESDYRGALSVGEAIKETLPDSRIAADFSRVKPLLNRQVSRPKKNGKQNGSARRHMGE